jgi:O-Antigen ligase
MELTTPSFPLYVTLPVCGAVLVLALVQLWRLRDVYVAFLLLAIWLRYSLAVLHEYTYPPVALGLSVVALSSIVVVAAGFVLIGIRNLLLQKLAPIYVIILLVLVSGGVNQTWLGTVNVSLKWLYLVVFAIAAYAAIERHGPDQVFGALATVFVGPIVLQWLSVPWGLQTVNEDRSLSFIGGYQHQQAFSIILLTFLYVTIFSPGLSAAASYIRLLIAAVGLAYANYRTAILAAALPAASLVVAKGIGKLVPRQRSVAFVFLGAVAATALVGIASLAQDRFVDLSIVLDKGASLIQPPEYFTADEKRLFSGRVHLWSLYINGYLDGNIINLLFGFGPESWVERFALYAHNTFISHLYELGIFGLAALVWFVAANTSMAARLTGNAKITLLSCHIGFIVLNMATMAIWTVEGDILYGLLLAQTWYMRSLAAASIRPRVGAGLGATALPVR